MTRQSPFSPFFCSPVPSETALLFDRSPPAQTHGLLSLLPISFSISCKNLSTKKKTRWSELYFAEVVFFFFGLVVPDPSTTIFRLSGLSEYILPREAPSQSTRSERTTKAIAHFSNRQIEKFEHRSGYSVSTCVLLYREANFWHTRERELAFSASQSDCARERVRFSFTRSRDACLK